MAKNQRIRASFTSFISKVIENTAINYKRKLNYISKREIHLSEEMEIGEIIKSSNSNVADTLIEEIDYLELEKVFNNEEYANAMKQLNDREKLVLYLTIIEEISIKKVAIMLDTTEDNVSVIKYRSKNKFLKYLRKGGNK